MSQSLETYKTEITRGLKTLRLQAVPLLLTENPADPRERAHITAAVAGQKIRFIVLDDFRPMFEIVTFSTSGMDIVRDRHHSLDRAVISFTLAVAEATLIKELSRP